MDYYYVDGFIQDDNIFIEFERKMCLQSEDKEKIFHFEATLQYVNKEYDVAVLELKERIDEVDFPPCLTLFSKFPSPCTVHLIGHPEGRQMKEDSEVMASFIYPNNRCDKRIEELGQWSKQNLRDTENPSQNKDYYIALRRPPRKILFDTTFGQGSSGSPGVIEKDGREIVVLIMRGGVPTCYYENKIHVEPNRRVEYGYAMEDICKKMKMSKMELARRLFGGLCDDV
jgi:hypothetical protein